MSQQQCDFIPLLVDVRIPLDDEAEYTTNFVYEYNGYIFDILLSPPITPGNDASNSIELQYLQKLEDITVTFHGSEDEDQIAISTFEDIDKVEQEIGIEVIKASREIMQSFAPEVKSSS